MYRIRPDHVNGKLMVYKDGEYVKSFDTIEEAQAYIRADQVTSQENR